MLAASWASDSRNPGVEPSETSRTSDLFNFRMMDYAVTVQGMTIIVRGIMSESAKGKREAVDVFGIADKR